MAITLVWDDTLPNIVQYRFQKGWTWHDFRRAALTEHQWGEALHGVRYDIIGDLSHAAIPSGTPFTNVTRLFEQGPPNRRMIVIVSSSAVVGAMIQIAGRMYPQIKGRFHAAASLEEARALIVRLREREQSAPSG
ncbi:MAG: hypothetical protein SF162_15785 [bacterium]|nr:hypothetical protein [bacterium]